MSQVTKLLEKEENNVFSRKVKFILICLTASQLTESQSFEENLQIFGQKIVTFSYTY